MVFLKVFNVEHGDSMLFQAGCVFQNIPLLIDTGSKKYNIYQQIHNEQFDIMITHSDGDHIGGLDDFLTHKSNCIQNIYLPLYQPEINKIFSKLRTIGRKNATLIQQSQNLISQYISKIVFVYDGWEQHKKQYSCNLAKCSHTKILNPPLGNFDFLNENEEFLEFTFDEASRYIREEELFESDFSFENYVPENLNDQNQELIAARKEYFKYVIRLIGYTISKGSWTKQSTNKLFRLSNNDASIVLHYKMQDRFSILFTGDAGDKILKNLIQQGKLGQTDILKVPHHGGANSVGRNVLNTIQPKYAILSHNSQKFGNGSVPNQKSINELQSRSVTILSTNAVTNLTPTPPINQTIGLVNITSLDEIEFI